MNIFFIDKIDNIQAEFPLLEANLPCTPFFQWILLCQYALLLYIILTLLLTTCSSDPFPTRLLLSHLHVIVPILQHIVNLCLITGDFPTSCKSPIVIPLIMKPCLDREMFEKL